MNIFVISMTNALKRRESCKQQLDSAGMPFSFFDAQVVINGFEDFFAAYDEKEFQINTGRKAAKGEIGCYASHLALWKKCIELNEPIIIMEDDFVLTEAFPRAVSVLEVETEKYGYIRLQSERRGKSKKVKNIGEFELCYYTKMPHSLMCYSISPKVAQQFVKQAEILDAPVDVMIKKIWEHKQRLYGLMPYTVIDGELGSESTILGREKHKKTINIQIARFFRKISWGIKRIAFTIFFSPPKNKG